MQDTGRGPENGGKNAENFEAKEKRGMTDFLKRSDRGGSADTLKATQVADNTQKNKTLPPTGRS